VKTSADLAQGVIRAEIEINAPPEKVFEALTDPAQLEQWWGSADYYRTRNWVSDLRPGGERSGDAIGADGKVAKVRGEYRVVDKPRLLEFTWEPSWDDFVRTVVRAEITRTDRGSVLVIEHSGFAPGSRSCEGHAQGWGRVLGWLERNFPAAAGHHSPSQPN
jgi:uncharacterized protein YndB with AHSA1/START domain